MVISFKDWVDVIFFVFFMQKFGIFCPRTRRTRIWKVMGSIPAGGSFLFRGCPKIHPPILKTQSGGLFTSNKYRTVLTTAPGTDVRSVTSD